MQTATAPGKLILCGEHAVVYGQPAIALPVFGVGATATIVPADDHDVGFEAPDLGERWTLASQPDHPLSQLFVATMTALGVTPPGLAITLRSTIPIASGMGSGAALGAALVRAAAAAVGHDLAPEQVSTLVYESERVFHGTPSGIDNTVVSFGRPIWFQRIDGQPTLMPLTVGAPLHLVVGDTGVHSPTKATVGGVRERWAADPVTYDALFQQIGALVVTIRSLLAGGQVEQIGRHLDHNHALLQQIGVSSPELDRLVATARQAGAWGAKLSGGGGGGVMLALVDPAISPTVAESLRQAGATQVLTTTVEPT